MAGRVTKNPADNRTIVILLLLHAMTVLIGQGFVVLELLLYSVEVAEVARSCIKEDQNKSRSRRKLSAARSC